MTIKVCGDCKHFATTEHNKREGACMACVKAVDGHWDYHPRRESNRYACGFFKEKGKGEAYGVR